MSYKCELYDNKKRNIIPMSVELKPSIYGNKISIQERISTRRDNEI